MSLVATSCPAPAPAPAPAPPAPAPAPPPAPPPAPKVKVDLAIVGTPEDAHWHTAVDELINYIEEATNGRAEVTPHYGGTLLAFKDMYRGTAEGIADATWCFPTVTPGVFPLQELFGVPGLFETQAQSASVILELHQKYPCFEEEFGPKVKLLTNHALMTSDIHSRIPIRSLAEMKGKTLVAQNEITVKALKAMGVETSVMPATEVYMAAERGVIDGIVTAWGWVHTLKLYEQLPYHTELNICPMPCAFLFNRATFEDFTEGEQRNLERLWPWITRAMVAKNIRDRILQNETYLAEPPQELIEFPKEDYEKIKLSFQPMLDDWAERLEAAGYPGSEIVRDAIRWADAYAAN